MYVCGGTEAGDSFHRVHWGTGIKGRGVLVPVFTHPKCVGGVERLNQGLSSLPRAAFCRE